MKQLKLNERFSKLVDVPISDTGEKQPMTPFYMTTMSIINSGDVKPRDMAHYKQIRKSVKRLAEQKTSDMILLEDSDYRNLFGTADDQGIIRRYNGWLSNDATDEFIEIWENATNQSIEVIKKKEGKAIEEV
jgi:hypothetical protein